MFIPLLSCGFEFIHWRIILTHVPAYILHTTLILHSSQLVIAAACKLHVWCCGKMAELVLPWDGEVYVLSVWPGLRDWKIPERVQSPVNGKVTDVSECCVAGGVAC